MEELKKNKGIVTISYRVPYADTDQMKVVYYANYFVYFERLRNELFRATGIPYTEIEARDLMFPVHEAHCEYENPALYDDLIEIRGWLAWVQGSRFQINYEIIRDNERLVTGHTIHVVVNRDLKPRRVPAEVQMLLPEKLDELTL